MNKQNTQTTWWVMDSKDDHAVRIDMSGPGAQAEALRLANLHQRPFIVQRVTRTVSYDVVRTVQPGDSE